MTRTLYISQVILCLGMVFLGYMGFKDLEELQEQVAVHAVTIGQTMEENRQLKETITELKKLRVTDNEYFNNQLSALDQKVTAFGQAMAGRRNFKIKR